FPREDLYNLELTYLVLKEYKKKLDETKNMLCELSRNKVQLITRKRKFEETIENNLVKSPQIVNSPVRGARNKQNKQDRLLFMSCHNVRADGMEVNMHSNV
ncbi:18237_t:CDS:1, partial [Gigaspora margarita]